MVVEVSHAQVQSATKTSDSNRKCYGHVYIAEPTAMGAAVFHALQNLPVHVEAAYISPPNGGRQADLLVSAIDGPLVARLRHWEDIARNFNMRLLCIHVQEGEALIGPEIVPERPGCLQCWVTRYYNGRSNARRFAVAESLGSSPPIGDPFLTPLLLSVVGTIAAHRIQNLLRQERASPEGWSVYHLNLETMTGSEHRLLPDPLCPRCSHLQPDDPEHARVCIKSRPKPRESADRLKDDIRSLFPKLCDSYVSRRGGVVHEMVMSFPIKHIATATAGISLGDRSRLEPCSGFCSTYDDAQAIAILEALERYSSYCPRARRPAIHGTAASLGSAAADPRRFGLPSKSEYEKAKILTRYDEEVILDWVWAYSFRKKEPVLVPRQLAFYSASSNHELLFAVEGSNGCSLGSCPEEAILHGILEVIERDSFLFTWYARLRNPALDPMESNEPEVRARCRRLQFEGYEIIALDTTTDFNIPSLLMAARCKKQVNKLPYFVAVGAAHYRPEKALLKASRELTACFSRYSEELKHAIGSRRAHELIEDPSRVRTIEDHALLYSLPQSAAQVEFLTGGTKRTSIRQMTDSSRELWSSDLSEELRNVIDRVMHAGHDVIAVNQTAPELSPIEMYNYKVLIPGAIPMTFGSTSRRLEGIERLKSALQQCGRELNPAPHPLP